jgi:uncharacterized protein (DUF1501 family)
MERVNRRRFLAGIGGAAVAGGAITASQLLGGTDDRVAGPSGGDAADSTSPASPTKATVAPTTVPAPTTTAAPKLATTDLMKRRLVVLELAGGIDGMSLLIPAGQGAYRDLRPTVGEPEEGLLWWDKEVALHANLKRMNGRGLAAVQGIGAINPAGSHFSMIERWWAGQVESNAASTTGFFGRLCDKLGDPAAPYVGVTLGQGKHAAMLSDRVRTLGLPSADRARYLAGAQADDPFQQKFQAALAQIAAGPADGLFGEARRTWTQAISAAQRLQGLPDSVVEYPKGRLGDDLATAARMIAADSDVRVIYVPVHMNFDTHVNHIFTNNANLDAIDQALDAFLEDIKQRGFGDSVLVATISEFGRRAAENGEAGLDHGSASVAFMAGAVQPGRYGEYSSLTDLDENDNLIPTVAFDRYYATLAESWFGIASAEVLTSGARPLEDVRF